MAKPALRGSEHVFLACVALAFFCAAAAQEQETVTREELAAEISKVYDRVKDELRQEMFETIMQMTQMSQIALQKSTQSSQSNQTVSSIL